MTLADIVNQYSEGRTTDTGFALDILALVDAQNVHSVLSALSPDLRDKVKSFLGDYRPGLRVFNADPPSVRSVELAREWFELR
jgi:hypothetical protein